MITLYAIYYVFTHCFIELIVIYVVMCAYQWVGSNVRVKFYTFILNRYYLNEY